MLFTRPEPFNLSKTNFNKKKYAENSKFSDITLVKLQSSLNQKPKKDSIFAVTVQGKLVQHLSRVKPSKERARRENQSEVDFNYVPDVYFQRPKVIVKTQARDGRNKELKFFPDRTKEESFMAEGGPTVYSNENPD